MCLKAKNRRLLVAYHVDRARYPRANYVSITISWRIVGLKRNTAEVSEVNKYCAYITNVSTSFACPTAAAVYPVTLGRFMQSTRTRDVDVDNDYIRVYARPSWALLGPMGTRSLGA